jgi:adenylate kinase family enzyme
MKIAIIGSPGSGKSTLGLKLHKILGIPLYHLDQYFWKPGWVEPNRAEFQKKHNEICDKDEWILEGQGLKFFEYRIERADIIIFLDIPMYLCFYRVLKRAITHFGRVYFSSAKGCPEKGPTLKFLKYIWDFNKDKKPFIESLFRQYSDTKKLYVIKNNAELNELLKNVF